MQCSKYSIWDKVLTSPDPWGSLDNSIGLKRVNHAQQHYYYMGHEGRKSVFGVSEEVRFKPACSATETS